MFVKERCEELQLESTIQMHKEKNERILKILVVVDHLSNLFSAKFNFLRRKNREQSKSRKIHFLKKTDNQFLSNIHYETDIGIIVDTHCNRIDRDINANAYGITID